MKAFFQKFSRPDWLAFVLCVIFFILTVLPMTPVVALGQAWHTIVLISCAAVTLSTIVVAQIQSRESDRDLVENLSDVRSLVRSSLSPTAVREIPATQIRDELECLLHSCTEWYFRGGSARWQRESVLPKLAEITDRPVSYKVQVISPFEESLCEKYARYRRKTQPGDPRGETRQIQLELLAYIYAVVVWQSKSKISAEITLLHRFSPFRLDGDSRAFLITVADSSKNGLYTPAGNWYHASLLDEFEFEAGYATKLVLPSEASDAESSAGVFNFFEELRQLNPDALGSWQANYDESTWEEILRLAGTTNVQAS